MEETGAALGDSIRATRQALGLGQAALADRAGVHRMTISAIERGRRPEATTLEGIAAALGLDADELARLAGPSPRALAARSSRACAVCGREVLGTPRRMYCGVRCKMTAFRDRAMAEAGRARLAACAECRAPLASGYRNRMYCGPVCKVRAHRRRRR